MATLPQLFQDRRLGSDLLWRDIRTGRFPQPAPALFLDRDGVVIEEKNYISSPEQVVLLPGIPELIGAARQLGMAVVEVTNQAGIGRGYFGWPEFVRVEDRIAALLAGHGVTIDAVFACPFHPEGRAPYRHPNHPWRKPNPGLLIEAAEEMNLALDRSILVGDKDLDQLAARNAGLKLGIHVLTGYGRECESSACAVASHDFTVHVCPDASGCLSLLRSL
jgi:D-glycero-D-manno-heptose 1,7-bisphosphate phosphatase